MPPKCALILSCGNRGLIIIEFQYCQLQGRRAGKDYFFSFYIYLEEKKFSFLWSALGRKEIGERRAGGGHTHYTHTKHTRDTHTPHTQYIPHTYTTHT
jgi:hypothetical protein